MTTSPAAGTVLSAIALARKKRQEKSQPLPSPARRREIRDAAGLTQTELAQALGVTQTSVVWWERDDGYDPSARNRAAYRKLLAELEAEVRSWKADDCEVSQAQT